MKNDYDSFKLDTWIDPIGKDLNVFFYSTSIILNKENIQGPSVLVDEPSLSLYKDTNDSIIDNKLLENEGNNEYYFESEHKDIFDNDAYSMDLLDNKNISRHKFIIKVPSRVNVANGSEFGVVFRLAKGNYRLSENAVIKLISNSFYFSESIFQISEVEKEIRFSKRTPFIDYNVKIKVYYNNEVVEERLIDLYKRK